jgi:RNA polymerase sigma-70 factor (ECF subfamily)
MQPAVGAAGQKQMRSRVGAAEDRADVDSVLEGDISAFGGIVRRWQGPLVNLAYRFCRDRGHAEDMTQEAFLRAFHGLGTWRREAAFSTWLFALATNLYRSRLKRAGAVMIPLDKIDEPRDPRPEAGGFVEHDKEEALRRAVLALPAKFRDALILFYFHEMDVSAAARSLGVPQGTVKARLSRGRKMLRDKFSQQAAKHGHRRADEGL